MWVCINAKFSAVNIKRKKTWQKGARKYICQSLERLRKFTVGRCNDIIVRKRGRYGVAKWVLMATAG